MSIKKFYILALVMASLTGGLYAREQWKAPKTTNVITEQRDEGLFSIKQASRLIDKRVDIWERRGEEPLIRDPDGIEKNLKKLKNYDKLPARLKEVIYANQVNWYYVNAKYKQQNKGFFLFSTDDVDVLEHDKNVVMDPKTFAPEVVMDGWMQREPLNPKTKKPWFVPKPAQIKKCPAEEQEKLNHIFNVVNENYQFLMATPLTQLDKQKWNNGDYAGKYIQAPYLTVGEWSGFMPEQAKNSDLYPIYQKLGSPLYNLVSLPCSWIKGIKPYRINSVANNCLYWFSNIPRLTDKKGRKLPLGYSDLRVVNVSQKEAQGRISWFQVDILIKSLALAEQEWPKAFDEWRREMSPEASVILTALENDVLGAFSAEKTYLQKHHSDYGWSIASDVPNYDRVYRHQLQRVKGQKQSSGIQRTIRSARTTQKNQTQSRKRPSQREREEQ